MPSYTFAEGNGEQICIQIDGIFRVVNGFTATIQIQDDEGKESTRNQLILLLSMTLIGDFGQLIPATFNSMTENMMECVAISPLDDSEAEGTETFTVTLSANQPIAVSESANSATITLLDLQGI